jgi:hypothetical protein
MSASVCDRTLIGDEDVSSSGQRVIPLAGPHLEVGMIILGLILLVVGLLTGISILTTIGIILLVVGAVLTVLGAIGRPVGGRKHYF